MIKITLITILSLIYIGLAFYSGYMFYISCYLIRYYDDFMSTNRKHGQYNDIVWLALMILSLYTSGDTLMYTISLDSSLAKTMAWALNLTI